MPLFQALLADADFRAARFDIHWLDRKLASGELAPVGGDETPEIALIAAAIVHYERSQRQVSGVPHGAVHRGGWRSAARHDAVRRGGRA